MELRLDIEGQQELARALSAVARDLQDWRPAWQGIESIFYAAEKRLFESQGASGSERWAPLSRKYAALKARKFPGRPILVRSGSLKRSLIGRSSQYAIHDPQPTSLALGTSHPAASAHGQGRGRLPRRRPIDLTVADYERFATRMVQRMVVIGKGAGFKTVAEAGI